MARLSSGEHKIKLEADDIISVMGVKGKVLEVNVIPSLTCVEGITKKYVDVLVTVDFTRGTGEPNVLCIEEIEAVKMGDEWVNRKGETVEV